MLVNNKQSIGTVTEQASPPAFIDIPEYETKFFQQLGQYNIFESAIGTVHLIHVGKNQKDAAVLNSKGTLMFINPTVSISEDDWRKLFQNVTTLQ